MTQISKRNRAEIDPRHRQGCDCEYAYELFPLGLCWHLLLLTATMSSPLAFGLGIERHLGAI